MGDKIVKSKNLCCQPIVFTRCSLLSGFSLEATENYFFASLFRAKLAVEGSTETGSKNCFLLFCKTSQASKILCKTGQIALLM